jgi:hypothetical protein
MVFTNARACPERAARLSSNAGDLPVLGAPLGAGAAHVVALWPVRVEYGAPGSTKFDQFDGQTSGLGAGALRLLYGVSHDESRCVCRRIVPAEKLQQNQLVVLGRSSGSEATRFRDRVIAGFLRSTSTR